MSRDPSEALKTRCYSQVVASVEWLLAVDLELQAGALEPPPPGGLEQPVEEDSGLLAAVKLRQTPLAANRRQGAAFGR